MNLAFVDQGVFVDFSSEFEGDVEEAKDPLFSHCNGRHDMLSLRKEEAERMALSSQIDGKVRLELPGTGDQLTLKEFVTADNHDIGIKSNDEHLFQGKTAYHGSKLLSIHTLCTLF